MLIIISHVCDSRVTYLIFAPVVVCRSLEKKIDMISASTLEKLENVSLFLLLSSPPSLSLTHHCLFSISRGVVLKRRSAQSCRCMHVYVVRVNTKDCSHQLQL